MWQARQRFRMPNVNTNVIRPELLSNESTICPPPSCFRCTVTAVPRALGWSCRCEVGKSRIQCLPLSYDLLLHSVTSEPSPPPNLKDGIVGIKLHHAR
ncbi:hypothetical protein B0I35DRAFT_428430 [Stachybotrys elegans]|uniref:Uncharacterized protein n=1 Tax=Stachybotrys elegans TaxID=80388 RepID=A0A8K0SYC3_9HYPO|nr:hypothetical protein B0I35DRAFT_428430 [Stachybotrys elegans]